MTEPIPTAPGDEPAGAPVNDGEPTASTPEPVVKAAAIWGSLTALIVTVIGILVSLGVLSSEEAAAVSNILDYVSSNLTTVGTVIVGVVGLISGLFSAGATAAVARRKVTPVPEAALGRHSRRW